MYTRSHILNIPLWHKITTKMIFFALATFLVMVFVFYVYLVNKTVANIVARQSSEQTIASLSGSIGDMEFKYINLKNQVTLNLAYSKGFKDASPTAFISRAPSVELSYNTSR